mmetsp:Transcript_23501/g.41808  ORF Transcript_23501/g.41808 Transcript_23501/m.41808 type:complete len:203 (-) Transcript_23501:1320-1928(-)
MMGCGRIQRDRGSVGASRFGSKTHVKFRGAVGGGFGTSTIRIAIIAITNNMSMYIILAIPSHCRQSINGDGTAADYAVIVTNAVIVTATLATGVAVIIEVTAACLRCTTTTDISIIRIGVIIATKTTLHSISTNMAIAIYTHAFATGRWKYSRIYEASEESRRRSDASGCEIFASLQEEFLSWSMTDSRFDDNGWVCQKIQR